MADKGKCYICGEHHNSSTMPREISVLVEKSFELIGVSMKDVLKESRSGKYEGAWSFHSESVWCMRCDTMLSTEQVEEGITCHCGCPEVKEVPEVPDE